jgi:hypothetical protein
LGFDAKTDPWRKFVIQAQPLVAELRAQPTVLFLVVTDPDGHAPKASSASQHPAAEAGYARKSLQRKQEITVLPYTVLYTFENKRLRCP